MLSIFHTLSNDILSKLLIREQINPLKKKEKVSTYILFPFDSKGFCTSAPVLVKSDHSEMGRQYLFSFIIITGIILQSTQGNTCKQTSKPCVYNLLEFREREGNYFLIIPIPAVSAHTSGGTQIREQTEQHTVESCMKLCQQLYFSMGPEWTPRGY